MKSHALNLAAIVSLAFTSTLPAQPRLLPPTISKGFGAPAIGVGQSTSLSFTFTNPNAAQLNGISFTDALPTGLVVSTPNGINVGACNTLGGNVTASAGSNSVGVSIPAIPANGACTFSVNVTAVSVGTQNNSVTISSTDVSGSNTATASVIVALPPAISKAFTSSKIAPGGNSTLTLTITNPNGGTGASGIGFTDTLPAGVTVAAPTVLMTNCPGGVVAAGGGIVTLSAATLAASASCTVSVNVTSTEGIMVNTTGAITSNFGNGGTATATLFAATPPIITKSFGQVSIGPLNTVRLRLTLRNPNTIVPLTGLTVTDLLPAGLLVSNPGVVIGSCGGGTITVDPIADIIGLTNATLAPGATCTFAVDVTADGTALGLLTNTTGTVASNEALPSLTASANIFIGDPFQIKYVSNLASGDSFIDITNAAPIVQAQQFISEQRSQPFGAELQQGNAAATTGAICANVYAFTPDEQLVSCCSCPVTPNGLVSFSAQTDLASNTLTPAVPTALVVKVLATVPVAGSCANSAAAVGTEALAIGLKSFGTTLHTAPTGAAATFGVTETPFSTARLSAGELARIGTLCNFIIANGSGFGVCRSCRLGGLGGARQ